MLAFAAGFLVRPFGAIFFGRLGDMIGRKYTLLVTMVMMCAATFIVGLLPNYAPKAMNKGMVLLILVYLVILVTMVYGPIAAMLVEMFPTWIRYTSMSLPYHIGNGWFGGLLPTTAFAMVAATGDIFYGLWYPVIVAAGTFIIGMLFICETKDVDIYARD